MECHETWVLYDKQATAFRDRGDWIHGYAEHGPGSQVLSLYARMEHVRVLRAREQTRRKIAIAEPLVTFQDREQAWLLRSRRRGMRYFANLRSRLRTRFLTAWPGRMW